MSERKEEIGIPEAHSDEDVGLEEAGWTKGEISEEEAEELAREMAEWAWEDAKEGLQNLAHRLHKPILEGRYTAVLGDDTSGRLPAIFLGHLMKRVAQEQGRVIPGRYFIAGGIDISERRDSLQQYLHEIRPKLGNRTLIVTEQFYTFASTVDLAELLKREGIAFDVAAVESIIEEEDLNGLASGQLDLEDESILLRWIQKHLENRSDERTWTEQRIKEALEGVDFYVGKDYEGAHQFYKKPTSGVEKVGSGAVAQRAHEFDASAVRESRKRLREFEDEVYGKEFVPELRTGEVSGH